MLAIIRLRGKIKTRKDIDDTLNILHLKKVNALSIVDDNKVMRGMINKVNNFVTWGEVEESLIKETDKGGKKYFGLKPARGGLKSIKRQYPVGDLGYRGKEINTLIKRML
ncbi:MAG: uL30 family ribosomal protein [Candidatus Aenigmarchaeota archaeon]|nr:uL30 family ribosomal protein [Candidatus Aenigmarchaeota archaeon]